MPLPKKEQIDFAKNLTQKKCACVSSSSTLDLTSKNEVSHGMHSVGGRMLCVGHETGPIKEKKKLKPKVPSKEVLLSTKDSLSLQEQKLPEKFQDKFRYISVSERHKKALNTRLNLPYLDTRGVRRFRFPCTVYIPMELEEDGYPLSASIVHGFIQYNDNMRMLAVKGSPFYDEPQLSEKPDTLLKIAAGLARVEDAGKKVPPDCALQIDSLLEMAFDFLGQGETIAWIVEKFLLMAIDQSSNYPRDGYKREALSRFAYGCFLRNFQLYDHAIEELETARNLCLGKIWKIEFNYHKNYDTLQQEVSDVLCRVFLVLARKVRAKNPIQAVRYCSRALRRLGNKALIQLQAESLLELGLGYKEAGNYIMAEQVFLEYLRRYGQSSNVTGICTAYIQGALCYTRLGNVDKAREFLYYVLEAAGKAGLDELTAVAQRYIGESLLKMSFFKEASQCLVDSFKMYIKLNKQKESDELRILAAISMGMEVMPNMARLCNACIDDDARIHLLQLLRWQFHRKPFWEPDEEDAPHLPDKSLYTRISDDDDDFYTIGMMRMSLSDAKKTFIEYTKKRRALQARYLRIMKRHVEEMGPGGAHYEEFLPGYEPSKEERDYKPQDQYTIAGGQDFAKDSQTASQSGAVSFADGSQKTEKPEKTKKSDKSSSSSSSDSEESPYVI